MPRIVQWEHQIGRRLRLRDLFVFFTVVRKGSMAKAAAELAVSTPAVSEIIADLEHALGVRLLDRSPQGVVATTYGEALMRRGEAAFDELKQGVREIEFLADPTSGEIRVASTDSLAITVLPALGYYALAGDETSRVAGSPIRPRAGAIDAAFQRLSDARSEQGNPIPRPDGRCGRLAHPLGSPSQD